VNKSGSGCGSGRKGGRDMCVCEYEIGSGSNRGDARIVCACKIDVDGALCAYCMNMAE
jgi:hypothetical protein